MIGAIALVAGPMDDSSLNASLASLEAATRLASHLVAGLGTKASREPSSNEPRPTATGVKPLIAAGATAEEMAFSITNELCQLAGAEMVAIGLVESERVHILSISGLDDVRRQSPGVVVLRAAMEECLDARTPIVHQREEGWSEKPISTGHRLHKQWHAAARGDAVASIPLGPVDRPAAILSVRRRPDRPFKPKTIDELRARVEPLVTSLWLARKAHRGLLRHAADAARAAVARLLTPGHWSAKLAVAGVALVALWFCFGTIPFDRTVPAALRAFAPIHLAAPFDGVLASVSVIEGDRVRAGDVLCELETTDLRLQRAELLAQLSVLEREKDRATAAGQPVDARLALANQEWVQARLALLERRIERAIIRAPIDGVVVAGDLRTRVGGQLPVGEPLLTVAPSGRWTLELSVSESFVDELHEGLSGAFATFARPDEPQRFTVARVLPSARAHDQRTVFLAEAEMAAEAGWIRPGMEGLARVHLGRRPVWWAALHRIMDYLRLNLWL